MKNSQRCKTTVGVHRRKKRHFQLLELMIAAFILLICIAPTMRIFTSMYVAQQDIVRENQRDHLAHLVHAKITERLYKRQLKLSDVKSQPIALDDQEIADQLKKNAYECEAILVIIDSSTPKGQDHPNKYLAQLVIKLKDVSPKAQAKGKEKKIKNQDPLISFYDYYIYIDAGFKENKNKKEGDDKQKDSELKSGAEEADKKKSPAMPPSPSMDAKGK